MARNCASAVAAPKVAGEIITSGPVCATRAAPPPNCTDGVPTSCLAASLQDCQAKVAATPMQNAITKRDAPAGNQTTEYSDRLRLSTGPIGTLHPAKTIVV